MLHRSTALAVVPDTWPEFDDAPVPVVLTVVPPDEPPTTAFAPIIPTTSPVTEAFAKIVATVIPDTPSVHDSPLPDALTALAEQLRMGYMIGFDEFAHAGIRIDHDGEVTATLVAIDTDTAHLWGARWLPRLVREDSYIDDTTGHLEVMIHGVVDGLRWEISTPGWSR